MACAHNVSFPPGGPHFVLRRQRWPQEEHNPKSNSSRAGLSALDWMRYHWCKDTNENVAAVWTFAQQFCVLFELPTSSQPPTRSHTIEMETWVKWRMIPPQCVRNHLCYLDIIIQERSQMYINKMITLDSALHMRIQVVPGMVQVASGTTEPLVIWCDPGPASWHDACGRAYSRWPDRLRFSNGTYRSAAYGKLTLRIVGDPIGWDLKVGPTVHDMNMAATSGSLDSVMQCFLRLLPGGDCRCGKEEMAGVYQWWCWMSHSRMWLRRSPDNRATRQ